MPRRDGSQSPRLAYKQAGRETQSLRPTPGVHSAPGSISPEVLGIRLRAAAGAPGIRRVSNLKRSSSLRGSPRPGLHSPGAVMREESELLSISDWLLKQCSAFALSI